MLTCNCPASAALPDIPFATCIENFGQLQKLIFQRKYSTGSTLNKITNPTVLASWTPLLAAADGTKVVVSPFVEAPTFEPGAPKTYGGNNETLNGIELITGADPTSFTANINRSKQDAIKALKKLMCENVGVYFANAQGQIGCLCDEPSAPTEYYPIPVAAFFVGDKAPGGFENPDKNIIQFKLLPNWSDNFVVVTPTDFNALTDLATPVVES